MTKIKAEEVYTEEVGNLYDEAADSKNPKSRDYLLDLAAENGVDANALVLDIGCANGGVSRKLLEKTGCKIEGVELLPLLVDMGNKQNKDLGLKDKFNITLGSITDIPFPDGTFDFVFCNDVTGMVEDLETAMAECNRVLKPSGKMLLYASFATERLSELEARELNDSLGNASEGTDKPRLLTPLKKNFTIVKEEVIGSQFTQHDVEITKGDSEAAKNLLKVARLLTWSDDYKAKHGDRVYQIVLAEVQWNVFILIGKLQPTVFIVQKDKLS